MMSGLVGYGSSDDDDAPSKWEGSTTNNSHANDVLENPKNRAETLRSTLVGPQAPTPQQSDDEDGISSPLSPSTAKRVAFRNMTMPPLLNLDIPPSPTGSPPSGMTEKFEHFMQLKKQGVHFNEKLASSSALKNPMLLQKLMASAGLAESDQHATTLPTDLWDPSAFPDWAYKEELAKSQQKIRDKGKEESMRTQRENIDFVAAVKPEGSINGEGTVSGTVLKGVGLVLPKK
ncbi:MAG: hypothetical protein Q9181_001774 [Wetmoreana brouardii]